MKLQELEGFGMVHTTRVYEVTGEFMKHNPFYNFSLKALMHLQKYQRDAPLLRVLLH